MPKISVILEAHRPANGKPVRYCATENQRNQPKKLLISMKERIANMADQADYAYLLSTHDTSQALVMTTLMTMTKTKLSQIRKDRQTSI